MLNFMKHVATVSNSNLNRNANSLRMVSNIKDEELVGMENDDFYNGPQHQFMEYGRCIFLQSKKKKIILQISAYINIKFFKLFQEDACPCVDYNCRYLKILNKRYYQLIKSINKNEKVYRNSILNYFKDDWGQAFFEITSESS